jgi:hypothetical protein
MRTTIRLDDQLLREAKRAALESGLSLTAFIEDSLREALARRQSSPTRAKVTLKTIAGGHLQPGVDLDDSAALLDIMDGRNARS